MTWFVVMVMAFCNNGFIPIGNVVKDTVIKDLVYEDVSKSDDCKKETLLRKIKSVCYQLSLLEGKECFIMNLSYKKKKALLSALSHRLWLCAVCSLCSPAVAGAADDTESDTTKKRISLYLAGIATGLWYSYYQPSCREKRSNS